MTFIKTLLAILLLALIGGFGYVALTDVPISQKEVTKTIPLSELPK
jgi:hypothetical protein